MSQKIPIYIPTFISDQNYNPNRVLPRLFFFNGMVDCETYYIESGSLVNSGQIKEITQFPYFDHYNVVTGSFPTTGSRSLLFLNEAPLYGEQPNDNLYTEYWSDYVNLLYSPKTRLINASAIIPLADYFDMELNDIVEWRSNVYHLRAINDYNLKTGECKIQLLGPIIEDALGGITPTTTTTTTTTTTAAPTTTTTSTTTTSTTTTTTFAAGFYYAIDKYQCSPPLGPCSLSQAGLVGYSTSALTPGNYYNSSGDGFVYLVNIELDNPEAYDINLSLAPSNADCVDACNI